VRRSLVAAALLAIPIAVTIGSTVRSDVDAIRAHARIGAADAAVVPPHTFPGFANVALLRGVRRLVPSGARVAFVAREPQEIYLQTGWIRWAAFAIAPRLVVEGRKAPWVVVTGRTPGDAGVRGRRSWRFGRDWLVER
jgi:hypothetical protein